MNICSTPSSQKNSAMLDIILKQNDQRLSEQERQALITEGFSTHHISTLALPQHERFDYWRGCLSYVYHGLEVNPLKENQDGCVDVEIAFTKNTILGVGLNDAAYCTFTQTDDLDADVFWLSFYFSLHSKAEAKLMQGRSTKDEIAIKVNQYDFILYDSRYLSALTNQAGSGAVLRLPVRRQDFSLDSNFAFPDPYRMTNFIKQSRLYPFVQGRIRFLTEHRYTLDTGSKKTLLLQIETMLYHILAEAVQTLTQQQANTEAPQSYLAQYTAAEHYILRRIAQPIHIDQLAKAIGCSTSQLYKIFSYYDTSPAKYISKLRLEHLAHLLKTCPEQPCSEIITRCGFDDLSQAGKIFRKAYGMSMSEWREQAPQRHNSDAQYQ